MNGLEQLLTSNASITQDAALSFARIDWTSARKELALFQTPLFEEIAAALDDANETSGEGGNIADILAGLETSEAIAKLNDIFASEIGRILRMPAEDIARHKPLSEIGMDSLMALELRMAAEQRLGIDIPLMSLSGGASLNDLSSRVISRFTSDEDDLSRESSTLSTQHLGDEVDADELKDLAALVEQKSQSVKGVLQ